MGMSTVGRMGGIKFRITVSSMQMTSRGAAGQDEHQEIKEDKEEAALAKALVVDESSRVTVEVSEHQTPDAKDWHGGYGQAPLDRDLPDQDCIRPPTTGSADTTLGRQLARKPDGGDGGGLKSRLHAWVSDACKDMPGMHAEVKGCIVAILSALAGDDGGCGGTWVGTGDASTSGEQAYGMQGMLVSGPPGVGKTRLVMTLLRSSPLAWMACKAPALYQAEAGATQQAIQAVFRRAARRAPCVLLIDDIEALAPRAPALNEEVEGRAAHCLLSCLDAEARRRAAAAAAGQGPRRARVFVIGATSRREALDPAMTQPGRLDAWVHLGVPTAVARRQMLALLTRHLPILPNSRAPAARRHHDQAEARAQTAAAADRESCLDRLAQAAHAYTPADLQLVLATALRRRLHSGPCEESSQAAAATQTVYSRGDNDQSDNDDEVRTSGDDESRDGDTLRASGASSSPWHGRASGRASGCGGRRWAGDGLTEQEVEEAMRVVRPAMLRDRTRRSAVAASRADGPTADASASSSQSPWHDLIDVSGVKLKLRTLVVEALSQRTKFARLGIQPPRGVLLYGPPGAGKTCLALGIAAEAASHANLIAVQATDLIHAQVGQSERAIARLFAQARACAPCLLLLDEIDMLAPPRRQAGMAASGGAQDRVLSQLLIELDGVKAAADAPVMVIAASARPDCIDAALLRPGRLDHHVLVPPPPRAARRLLLTRLMTAHPANLDDASQEARDASGLDPGGDGQALLDEMADCTDGWTLADVQNLCREAGMHALRAAVAAAPDCLPSRHLQVPPSSPCPSISLPSARAVLAPHWLLG